MRIAMSLLSKGLPKKPYFQDEDEKELESFLFCSNQNLLLKTDDTEKRKSDVDAETKESSSNEEDSGELLSFCISTTPGREELQFDVAEEIIHRPVTKLKQGKVRKAAWCDADDEHVSVDLKAVPLLKKLRKNIDEENIDGNKFQERLKSQFEKVVGAPAWADLDLIKKTTADSETDDDRDHDDEAEAIFKTSRNLLGTSASLPKSVLSIQRSTDLNFCFQPDAGVRCVEFHPSAKIALTAGLSKRLDLFQVDGTENPKIQSIFLEKFPVHSAHFCGSGDKVYLAARHPFYYCYDLIGGEIVKIPFFIGKEMRRCSRFVISPDSGMLAFLGDNGYLNLVSAKSHQFIAGLKMNGSIEAAAFSSETSKVYTTGGDGEVYLWDIGTRRCIHKFIDDGSLRSTCIDVSPDGSYLAVGSSSGVVNVYDEACLSKRRPTPVKTVLNLTTHIKTVKFNSTSELLAISSPVVKDALKLMHIPSMTMFSNWPKQTTPLGYVECLDFSPRSGYFAIGNTKGKALLYRLTHYQDC